MKRIVMLATIVAALSVSTNPVQAARRNTAVNRPQRTGIFARLIELERRKNAAIRRMFGRG